MAGGMEVRLFPDRLRYFSDRDKPEKSFGKSASVSMLFRSTRWVRLVISDPRASGIAHRTLLLRSSSARFFRLKRDTGMVSRMLL